MKVNCAENFDSRQASVTSGEASTVTRTENRAEFRVSSQISSWRNSKSISGQTSVKINHNEDGARWSLSPNRLLFAFVRVHRTSRQNVRDRVANRIRCSTYGFRFTSSDASNCQDQFHASCMCMRKLENDQSRD